MEHMYIVHTYIYVYILLRPGLQLWHSQRQPIGLDGAGVGTETDDGDGDGETHGVSAFVTSFLASSPQS